MPLNRLYHTWKMYIRQLRLDERITRIRNMTWLIVGIYQSRSVCLSRIAGKIPGVAKLLSTTRRLSRYHEEADLLSSIFIFHHQGCQQDLLGFVDGCFFNYLEHYQ